MTIFGRLVVAGRPKEIEVPISKIHPLQRDAVRRMVSLKEPGWNHTILAEQLARRVAAGKPTKPVWLEKIPKSHYRKSKKLKGKEYYMLDGHHRLAAHKLAGKRTIRGRLRSKYAHLVHPERDYSYNHALGPEADREHIERYGKLNRLGR